MISRREFARSLIAQAVLRAGLARAQAQSPQLTALFDIQRVSSRALIALARPAVMINSNAAVFELSRGLLVVDTHSKASAAAALAAQLRQAFPDKPVQFIVNTHFHYDHAHGNRAWHEAMPRPSVISTELTRQLMEQRAGSFVADSVESMRQAADKARSEQSRAQTPALRSYWQQTAEGAEAYVREMRGFVPDLPDITFDGAMVLRDPSQQVRLVFKGRAHTASDISVYSPSQRLIATGDLVVGFIPGMGDGFPLEWPATLDSLSELPFENVLPGHGGVQNSKARLRQMRDYINELNERTAEAKRKSGNLPQLQSILTSSTVRSLSGDYGSYVAAMTSQYRWMAPGADPWESIAQAVRGNIAAIWNSLPGPAR